jgi:hypothetical protein
MSEVITYWITASGPKRIEDLSREELIAAVKQMGREAAVHRELHRSTIEIHELARNARARP